MQNTKVFCILQRIVCKILSIIRYHTVSRDAIIVNFLLAEKLRDKLYKPTKTGLRHFAADPFVGLVWNCKVVYSHNRTRFVGGCAYLQLQYTVDILHTVDIAGALVAVYDGVYAGVRVIAHNAVGFGVQQYIAGGPERAVVAGPVAGLGVICIPGGVDGVDVVSIIAHPFIQISVFDEIETVSHGDKTAGYVLPRGTAVVSGVDTQTHTFICREAVVSKAHVAAKEVAVVHLAQSVTDRVVVGDIHMVPAAVQLHQVPGVAHFFADDVGIGDPVGGEQLAIKLGVALAHGGAVGQQLIGIVEDRAFVIGVVHGDVVMEVQSLLHVCPGGVNTTDNVGNGAVIVSQCGFVFRLSHRVLGRDGQDEAIGCDGVFVTGRYVEQVAAAIGDTVPGLSQLRGCQIVAGGKQAVIHGEKGFPEGSLKGYFPGSQQVFNGLSICVAHTDDQSDEQ